MSSIITNSLRILNSETFAKRITEQPTYIFIGKETPWADEELPDIPTESANALSLMHKDLLAAKRITGDMLTSVVMRINWLPSSVYDPFDHRRNMIDDRKQNGSRYRFYVLTDEFNVYKCLSNNGGAISSTKPTSQQITEFQTPDGYIWKYMYTIRSTDVFSFLTQDWMPVYTINANDGSSQWQVQENAIDGGIHDIVLDTVGAGFNPLTPPTVVIAGDGTGATATAIVNAISGSISRIVITHPGSGYTYATVSLINTGSGAGVNASAILSPVGGHGKNAQLELGGVNKMIKMSLNGREGGAFPSTTFRQAGVIYKPMSTDLGSRITVASTDGFEEGKPIVGDTTGAVGNIRLIDDNGRTIWVDSVVGSFLQSELVTSNELQALVERADNGTTLPLVAAVAPAADIVPRTGEFMYISNREKITRNDTQSEEIRFLVGF